MQVMEMMTYLTHKFQAHTLDETVPFQHTSSDDQDSGTESSDESLELQALVEAVQRQSERLASGVVFVASSPRRLPSRCAFKTCAAVSCSSLAAAATGLRCVCDVPRRPRRRHRTDGSSGDPGGRGLSDDPASSGGGGQREKRKWSQANARRGSCTSGGDSGEEDVSCSDDDEVRSLLASSSSSPVPLVFGSDPPRQARRLVAVNVPPAHASITRAAPQVCSLSPRKRHCQGDDVIEGRGVQRPSLDFEKMQDVCVM